MKSLRPKIDEFFSLFSERNLIGLSASIGFYLVMALTPFLLLLFTLTAVLGWGNSEEFRIAVSEQLGSSAAIGLEAIVNRLEADGGILSLGLIGLLAVLWSASGVIAEVQEALNRVLHIEKSQPASAAPTGPFIWNWAKARAFGVVAVLLCVLLALASFAGTLVLSWVLPDADGEFWRHIKVLFSLAVFSMVFAAMFRYLPTRSPSGAFALRAGVLCSFLFHLGNLALEKYFANTAFATSYGALSSFIVLLLWAQYNGLIVLVSGAIVRVFYVEKNPGPHHDLLPSASRSWRDREA